MKRPWRVGRTLRAMYGALYEALGPQHWWPGGTRTEIIVGAILTQNTAWANVELAIANLKRARCLTLPALRAVDTGRLAELIRPSGYFRVKARRLKSFIKWLYREYDGKLDRMFATEPRSLRDALLGVNGLGPETVDSILLYAGGVPTFVVDAYTQRMLRRHYFLFGRAAYGDVKALFEDNLPPDAGLYNEYHALLVMLGKEYCRPKARCERCPLRRWEHDAER